MEPYVVVVSVRFEVEAAQSIRQMSVPSFGGSAQAVERTHDDDDAPLNCLAEFVAGYSEYLLVGVGVYVGVADIAAEYFQVRLVGDDLEQLDTDRLDGG